MEDTVQLRKSLCRILPGAGLAVYPLPGAPRLRLLLLDGSYPQAELDQEAVRRVMDNPLYWVFCWASGQVLARFLLARPELVAGKRVLDFGCGSGVVAIAAALAGAREVIACDIDPLALAATRVNAALNRVSLTLADDFHAVAGQLDLIIVADVLYDRANLNWLSKFLARADQVLVADSRVKDFDFPPYRQVAREESHTLPDLDESAEFRDVRVYLGQGVTANTSQQP
jgi:predicted nicotinamide N-methyase